MAYLVRYGMRPWGTSHYNSSWWFFPMDNEMRHRELIGNPLLWFNHWML